MKKGNKKALKLGIMPKILAISIGCLLAALITAQAVTKNIASDKFVDNAKMNLSKLAEQKGDSIERFIESQKLLTHSVAIDGNIVTACQKYKTTGDINLPLQNKISAFLGDIQTQSGNLYENFFMTVENVGFADCLNNQTLHDVKEEPFYKECMKNGYFFGNNISPVTGNPVYVIAYAIQDPETGKYIGTVNNSIDLYTMTKLDVDDEEYDVKICTKEGQVIAAANPDDILSMDMSQINPEGWQQTLQSENGIADYYVPETGESGYVGYYVTDNFVTEVGILDKAFDGARADMTAAAVTITIIAAILSVVLIVLGCLTIVNPLKAVNKKIKSMVADINAGKGDLTTRVSVGTHDEVREMAESINMLLETFQGVMTMLNDASEKLEASSAAVRESIQVAEDQVSNVSSTMEEMAASSQETSASINMVVEKMTNINELVNTVYSQAIESSGESQKIVESVESLREAAFKERDESDAQTKIIIEALHKSMEAAKEVDRITELTEDILNIASETNLLSLNASIEAARAGEAGKGFAVVAQEISKLASNSTESANNIQSISETVIGSVNDLAKKAEEIAETLLGVNQSGRETVERITASYQNDIKSLAEEMDAFANKSSSVQSEIEGIKESIDHINGAVEENALGVTDVTTSAVEIAGNIANIAEEATSNLDVSKKIGEEVLKFKI